MTNTERNTINELEKKGYEQLFRDEFTGVFTSMHQGFNLNRKEAKAVAEVYRANGYRARMVGPNPYDFPFRVYVKKI